MITIGYYLKTCIFFILIINISFSQITFQKSFGGTLNDYGYSIIKTNDGGYAIAGSTFSFGEGSSDMYLVKVNSYDSIEWTLTIGDTGIDSGVDLIQTADQKYVITGTTNSFGAGKNDIYAVKLNSSGVLQWARTIGGTNDEDAFSVSGTSDGGCVICGRTYSFGAGGYDVYVIKLDISGNLQWAKTIGGTNEDGGSVIINTSDGGYIIGGYTLSFNSTIRDAYLIKLDASGALQWTKTIMESTAAWASIANISSIIQSNDGGYVVAGNYGLSSPPNVKAYAVKFNSTGALQWTKTIGSGKEGSTSIIQTFDGGYALAGFTNSSSISAGYNDVYVVKLDASGSLQWTRSVGGTGDDYGYSIIQTADGGFIIAGKTNTGNSLYYYDGYLVKLNSNGNTCDITNSGGAVGTGGIIGSGGVINSGGGIVGSGGIINSGGIITNICSTSGVNEINFENLISVYPNPASEKFYVELATNIQAEISLLDVYGREIKIKQQKEIDVSQLKEGVYFLHLKTAEGTAVKKIVVQR